MTTMWRRKKWKIKVIRNSGKEKNRNFKDIGGDLFPKIQDSGQEEKSILFFDLPKLFLLFTANIKKTIPDFLQKVVSSQPDTAGRCQIMKSIIPLNFYMSFWLSKNTLDWNTAEAQVFQLFWLWHYIITELFKGFDFLDICHVPLTPESRWK